MGSQHVTHSASPLPSLPSASPWLWAALFALLFALLSSGIFGAEEEDEGEAELG